MIFIVILADICLRTWVELQKYTDPRWILCSSDWWQIQVAFWTNNVVFGPKNHIKSIIFTVILTDIRLRISIDLQNYTNRRRILCSIDWWQIQRGCEPKISGLSRKTVKIHDFHSILCRHSLKNLRWPSKLYWSTQNFMLYRLVADSTRLWTKTIRFATKNHMKYMIFIVILADIRLRISVDLLKTHNFMLDGLVTDSKGVVSQKYSNRLKYFFTEILPVVAFSMCAGSLFAVPKSEIQFQWVIFSRNWM